MISVKDCEFGAVGDGITDDTEAIRAAIRAVEACGGGQVFFPNGIYNTTGNIEVVGSGVTLIGEHRKTATIRVTHPTNDLLRMIGWDSNIRHLGFDASVNRVAGAHVKLQGVRTAIEDFDMDGDFIGVHMTGIASRIVDGVMTTGAANGTRILVGGGDTSQIIDRVLIGAQDGPKPSYGIRVTDSSALLLSNTSVLTAGVCLAILPNSGDRVHSLYAHNCFFDSSDVGIRIVSANGGHVSRSRFIGCWTGGHAGNGVDIRKEGMGDCMGLHFTEHHSIGNGMSGFSIGPGVQDFSLNGGEIANNEHGLWFASGVQDFSVQNATIGWGGGVVANRGWGVYIGENCSRYVITGNRYLYNTVGGCNRSSSNIGIVSNNFG